MATYKLIQDIEAEDHILGPLTLRQFLYALGAVFFYYLCFISITKHVLFMLVLLLPLALFATFFAFPFSRDQPTEVWALAKIRYFLKPKKRIWSQSGVKELVTITAPKKTNRPLTNGLSESEARNRLEALAITIDSRGRAALNAPSPSGIQGMYSDSNSSDRLLETRFIPKPVPDYEVTPFDDILEDSNPLSIDVEGKLEQASLKQRANIVKTLSDSPPKNAPQQEWLSPPDEQALSNALKAKNAASGMSIQKLHSLTPPVTPPNQSTQIRDTNQAIQVKTAPPKPANPAILGLASTNNLSISTIAHEANEVVVKLH